MRGVDAAYTIASNLDLEGKMHQAVHMVFFAAFLREVITNLKRSLNGREPKFTTDSLLLDLLSRNYAHLYHAAVNTRTTKLLRDFLGDVCPCEVWKRTLLNSTERPFHLPSSYHG